MENSDLDDLICYVERVYVHGRHDRGRRPENPRFPPEIWDVYISVLNSYHKTIQWKAARANFKS